MLYYGRAFLITVIISTIISVILDPLVALFLRVRLNRPTASFVVCSLTVILLYLAGVGVYTQVMLLKDDLPVYSERIQQLIDQTAAKVDQFEKSMTALVTPKRPQPTPAEVAAATRRQQQQQKRQPNTILPGQTVDGQQPIIPEVRIHEEQTPFYKVAYGYFTQVFDILLMASFVPFLVYFMLAWRDHLRKRFLSLFQGEMRHAAHQGWSQIADSARGYVLGNFFLGLIVALASSIFFAALNLPYWLLVGPISGFLTLVPYLGLPLAIVPPIVAALPVHKDPATYIAIAAAVSILHLLALNLIYPKIVGSRVRLNPMVVTIALMFWGTIWGGIGLVLAVPITAGIKAVFDSVENLKPYGKLLGD